MIEKYLKQYEIRSYECDQFERLRMRSLFNIFQDLADKHADIMGFGYDFCLANNLGWVGSAYHIKINHAPGWEDKVELITWPSAQTPVTAVRDFDLRDKDGNTIIAASSQWVLIDTTKMRPVPIGKYLNGYEPILERALDTTFPKIPDVTRTDFESNQIVRFDDIDINKHVNNAVYPSWAFDGLPLEFIEKHTLKELQIAFKKPAVLGDTVKIKTQLDGNTTLHVITNADATNEFARIKLEWE